MHAYISERKICDLSSSSAENYSVFKDYKTQNFIFPDQKAEKKSFC